MYPRGLGDGMRADGGSKQRERPQWWHAFNLISVDGNLGALAVVPLGVSPPGEGPHGVGPTR